LVLHDCQLLSGERNRGKGSPTTRQTTVTSQFVASSQLPKHGRYRELGLLYQKANLRKQYMYAGLANCQKFDT
jgi:hypothetical protein